jgi:pyridoxal phosphate enzyme (YggS family)
MTGSTPETVSAAAARIRARIADAGGDPDRIRLVAVTKGQSVAVVHAAVQAGLVDLGESYAQELAAKVEALEGARGAMDDAEAAVRWHFVGGLQKNKVRSIAADVHLWQSVDRLSVAAEIARRAPGSAVLVQVNVSGVEQQGGCPPARTAAFVEGCTDLGLDVRGLMAIGARGEPDVVRASFRTVRELADRLQLPERSMGMSGDLEVAVSEGSTIVRVGTSLFGPRGGSTAVGK